MNKPTRGQWRGYGLLCFLLTGMLLAIIVLPRHRQTATEADHSPLLAAIQRYGDSMENATAAEREQWRSQHYQQRPIEHSYDSSWRNDTRRDTHTRKSNPNQPIDINNADTAALQQLYGIGPTFALRIVKYRDLLGGYTHKEQLLEVYGMDTERYNGFADHITLDPTKVRKIDINNASVGQLRRHPYLDYYQARAIVDYIKQGHIIHNINDLLKVNLIDPSTATKIQGYIQFN